VLRKLLPIIIVNTFLVLLFIYSNNAIWNMVNGTTVNYDNGTVDAYLITSHWGPIGINAPHYGFHNGAFGMVAGIFWYYNFPYWLFFISTVVNLYFIVKLSKNKTTQSRNFD
jgi:hypothetical protein